MPLKEFFNKQNGLFGKTFNTQKKKKTIQKHFKKQIKYSKIFLDLINKQLSIHITFEHVQSHKWNKHLLNIKLVCCVCGSSMNQSIVQYKTSMINSIHTQLVRNQVTCLTCTNEHIFKDDFTVPAHILVLKSQHFASV